MANKGGHTPPSLWVNKINMGIWDILGKEAWVILAHPMSEPAMRIRTAVLNSLELPKTVEP